jgi:hypothetical protein
VDITDGQLLRELKLALERVAGEGQAAQAAALEETLRRLGATMADVTRALAVVRNRRRHELAALAGRIGALAEQRTEAEDTADAVDRFLRGLADGGRA